MISEGFPIIFDRVCLFCIFLISAIPIVTIILFAIVQRKYILLFLHPVYPVEFLSRHQSPAHLPLPTSFTLYQQSLSLSRADLEVRFCAATTFHPMSSPITHRPLGIALGHPRSCEPVGPQQSPLLAIFVSSVDHCNEGTGWKSFSLLSLDVCVLRAYPGDNPAVDTVGMRGLCDIYTRSTTMVEAMHHPSQFTPPPLCARRCPHPYNPQHGASSQREAAPHT